MFRLVCAPPSPPIPPPTFSTPPLPPPPTPPLPPPPTPPQPPPYPPPYLQGRGGRLRAIYGHGHPALVHSNEQRFTPFLDVQYTTYSLVCSICSNARCSYVCQPGLMFTIHCTSASPVATRDAFYLSARHHSHHCFMGGAEQLSSGLAICDHRLPQKKMQETCRKVQEEN